jgi:hypothetical protein
MLVAMGLFIGGPVGLLVVRELFAQRWNAVSGPFDHVSIYAVMVYGDSLLMLMLLSIGWFELAMWRHQERLPAIRILHRWAWVSLGPSILVGRWFLDQFNEPRHGPVIYRQAWIFDIYHDVVAGVVLQQLLMVIVLLALNGKRRLNRESVIALVTVIILLSGYGAIWKEQPPKRVIRHGVTLDLRGYGGEWLVERLYEIADEAESGG